MSDDKIPPKVGKDALGGGTEEEHESYGMIGISRVSIGGYGGGQYQNFFGSDLNNHMSCMRIRICTGARRRSTGQYSYFARNRIIEVDLTAAQFAELITTQNVGDGVPCTLRAVQGRSIPTPPAVETSATKSQSEFEEKTAEIVMDGKRLLQRVREIADSKSVKKSDVRELEHDLRMVLQAIEKNLPFTLTNFREAIEGVVTEAKAEVEAFVTNAVATAGVQAISGRELLPNLLGTGEPAGNKGDPQ